MAPFLRGSCRFIPTCSRYGKAAIENFGFFKGSVLIAKRMMRCHPLSKHDGYDPIFHNHKRKK